MASFKSILKTRFIAFIAGLIYLMVLFVIFLLSYTFIEPKAYNYMLNKYSVTENKNSNAILVVIDDKSVARYRWPWKRELYGKIFEYLHNYTDSKFIAFDAILASDDLSNPESDKKLFNTIKDIDNLIVGLMPQDQENDTPNYQKQFYPLFKDKFRINITDKRKSKYNSYFKSVMSMPKGYFDSIRNAGSVYIYKENSDSYLKSAVQLVSVGDDFYPSLALKLYLTENNADKITLTDNTLIVDKTGLKIPGNSINLGFSNYVKFYNVQRIGAGSYSHKMVPAIDIIDSLENIKQGKQPIISPDTFKNKIVFVGANASATGIGLADRMNTPVLDDHPGVDYQAVNYDNLKNNEFISMSTVLQDILSILIFCLIVFILIYSWPFVLSLIFVLILCVIYYLAAVQAYKHNFSINLITPLIATLWTMVFAYSYRFITEGRNKEKIKNAMGKYLSQDIMQNVVKHIDDIKLGGKKANVTVLFADIRGFTGMSEKMRAEDVSVILNEYFTEIEPIIAKYNGVINKFIGDAVMAIFGEPIQDINHPQNAVRCAYEMLEKVAELRAKWITEGKPEIEIGIGINTGEAFVGNIGSEKRLEYTVIGDMVNLASRIESYNKVYKSNFLISSSTYEQVSSIVEVVKISDVKIRGKAKKMDIYEVLKIC